MSSCVVKLTNFILLHKDAHHHHHNHGDGHNHDHHHNHNHEDHGPNDDHTGIRERLYNFN